jgi:hypothetical protein
VLKATFIPEDFALDDDAINEIALVLSTYYLLSRSKKEDQEARWSKGLEQVGRLIKSAQRFLDDLEVVEGNPFVTRAIRDYPILCFGPRENPFDVGESVTSLHWRVESLIEMLNEIASDESIFAHKELPAVEIPKLNWHKFNAIHKLDGLLQEITDIAEQTERASTISELLCLVGTKLEQKSVVNTLSSDFPAKPDYYQTMPEIDLQTLQSQIDLILKSKLG